MALKEEKKETEIEDNPLTDEEAEAAFLEGTGETPTPSDTSEISDDKAGDEKPGDEKAGDEKASDEKPGDEKAGDEKAGDEKAGDEKPPVKPGISDDEKPGKKPTYEALEKALIDTKTWATGLSERVKALETPKPAPAKKAGDEPPATDEVPDEVKGFYADYPEAKNAILYEAGKLVKKQFGNLDPADVQKTVSDLQDTIGQNNFERAVVVGVVSQTGEWIPGHSDAYQVMANARYKTWFENERKINPTLDEINDPARAIDLLTRFKKETASAAASAHDKDQGLKAQDIKDIAAAAPEGGAQTIGKKPKGDDEKTPEELFSQGANSKK